MKVLRSNYHESLKEEFELEIIKEDKINYYVRLLPEYRDRYQEGSSITLLRKSLVGSLYVLVDKAVQLSLFDF